MLYFCVCEFFGGVMDFIKQHDENKQISMTAARAIIILLSLLQSPKSYEEIRQIVMECGLVNKELSVDTIRIDINTLKTLGCKITKATKTNNHKYGLISHPFKLKMTNDEFNALVKIYNKMIKHADVYKLYVFHKLFAKLASLVDDEAIKENLLNVSILNRENIDIVEQFTKIEKKHNRIKISYKPPYSEDTYEYDISVEKLGMRNGKLYVYCQNHSTGKRSFLNVSRIKEVIDAKFDRDSDAGLDTLVKFKLKSCQKYELEDNESIVENHDDYVVVVGRYFNDFIAFQRMLSFADDCTVLEPSKMKDIIVTKLKEMRAIYD